MPSEKLKVLAQLESNPLNDKFNEVKMYAQNEVEEEEKEAAI
jgi:hypothetical protein